MLVFPYTVMQPVLAEYKLNSLCLFSSADPLSNLSVSFDSKEEAIAFAVKSGKFIIASCQWLISLVPRPRVPPGEKRSGERSRISWAYYPKWVMTNEIARLVIITYLS